MKIVSHDSNILSDCMTFHICLSAFHDNFLRNFWGMASDQTSRIILTPICCLSSSPKFWSPDLRSCANKILTSLRRYDRGNLWCKTIQIAELQYFSRESFCCWFWCVNWFSLANFWHQGMPVKSCWFSVGAEEFKECRRRFEFSSWDGLHCN